MQSQCERCEGISLISTLIVVITLGLMATVAVAALSIGDTSKDKETKSLLNELNAPTPAGQAVAGAAAEAQMGGSREGANAPSLPSAARVAACKATAATVMSAVTAAYANTGSYPTTIGELVDSRRLDAAPSVSGYEFTLESSSGQPTGRVMVNGQPAEQGCSGPPR